MDTTRPTPDGGPPSWEPAGSARPAGAAPGADDDARGHAPHPGTERPGWQPPPPPPGPSGFYESLRRSGIWRGQDRWIGGVAAGVARRLDVDPLLVRGVLVVITLFGGLGLLLYGVAWALLPEESDGRIHLQEAGRGNVDAALAGALALVIIGLARPGTWWGGWWYVSDGGGVLLTLVVLGLVVAAVVGLARRRPGRGPSGYGSGPGAPQHGAAGSATWSAAAPTSDAPPRPAGAPAPGAPPWAGTPAPGTPPAGTWSPGTGATPPGYPAPARPYPARQYAAPPPAPPRPPIPGPGQTTVAVVLALCLAATAGVLLWDRAEPLGWLLPVVIGGVVLALLGLGIMVAGVRGRRGGALSVLGVLLALLVVPGTVTASVAPTDLGLSADARFGDLTRTPTTAAQAEQGYEILAGDLSVDLRSLDTADGPVTVPIDVGAGDVEVLVAADTAVRVEARVAAGDVQSRTRPGWSASPDTSSAPAEAPTGPRTWVSWASGMGIDTTLLSPAAQEDGADIVVLLRAGAGTIHIEEDA
ncbi:PspC domain-containing protein [Georgenia sp. 10Sc9-8]|uniref:PspC domain-containing protein n=1 Tax=Georgenia halotolerans TaxID=3028317 RepID=A0ABT5U2D6_9MICO|nr:PspC domain-containing protein [Georgenia halotolerans]